MATRTRSEALLRYVAVLLAFAPAACSTVGDVLVPANPRSDVGEPDVTCVSFTTAPRETPALVPLLVGLAKPAAEILIDQAARAIEKESERYEATFSARATGELLRSIVTTAKDPADPFVVLRDADGNPILEHVLYLNTDGFRLTRYHGEGARLGCRAPETDEPTRETVMELEARFETSTQRDAMRIVPTRFYLAKSKSKVAAPRWYLPWSWWLYLADSKQKVDVDVQVDLAVIATTKTGRDRVALGSLDLPFGKQRLREQPVEKLEKDLEHLASGWIPIPAPYVPDALLARKHDTPVLPVEILATVIEANDLGDVLAKGAEKLSKDKGDLAEKLISAIGLEEDDG